MSTPSRRCKNRHAALLLLAACLTMVAGCQIFSAMFLLFGPRQIKKTEFELTKDRLAVFAEFARPEESNAVFIKAFYDELESVFRKKGINTNIVPREEILRVRQSNPDFAHWSLQKVGRYLNARQVLYVRIERLQLYEAPDTPVLSPMVRMRLKVISPDAMADSARLWPAREERFGRKIEVERLTRDASDSIIADAEAAKLAKDAARRAAMPFYDVDLEEPVPPER